MHDWILNILRHATLMFQRQHWMVLAELRNIFHSVVTNVFNGTAHSAMFSIQGAPLQLPIDMFIFKLNSKRTICSFSYFYCAHLFFPFANSISFLPLNRNWCPLWSSFMDLFGEVKKREVHPLWSYLQSRNHVKKLPFSLNRSERVPWKFHQWVSAIKSSTTHLVEISIFYGGTTWRVWLIWV